MPDHVIKAVLATEDRRFFEHYGIDVLGTCARHVGERARQFGRARVVRRLTQQLAKNLFLTNERTVERKIKEAFLSIWLEANLSKKEILQALSRPRLYGRRHLRHRGAADFYFGKSVKDLNLAEAAMLAGLFKAPTKYAPAHQPSRRARPRQRRAQQPGRQPAS
jgi:penicillin-binding protein 1A